MNLQIFVIILWTAVVFFVGEWFGRHYTPNFVNAATIERRLREVFCEQAVHNDLLKRCDPTFPRYHQE